ncbi:hypothetical protein HSISB1_1334 [Streptococcus sp. HSISB1]|nr:hypothetical protein HSISB1_1334 [Streptococcus sp. HSISB1]
MENTKKIENYEIMLAQANALFANEKTCCQTFQMLAHF